VIEVLVIVDLVTGAQSGAVRKAVEMLIVGRQVGLVAGSVAVLAALARSVAVLAALAASAARCRVLLHPAHQWVDLEAAGKARGLSMSASRGWSISWTPF